MKKTFSIKQFFLMISIIMVLPFAMISVFFSFSMMNQVTLKDRQSNENTISIYWKDIQTKMEMIEQTMVYNWQNAEYRMTAYPLQPLQAHLSTWSIWNEYISMQRLYPDIGAMAVFSRANDICRCTYSDIYPYDLRMAIRRYSMEIDLYEAYDDWIPVKIDDKWFLVHTFGMENAYSVCFLDPEKTTGHYMSEASQNEDYFYFYDSGQGLLASGEWEDAIGKELRGKETSDELRLNNRQYMLTWQPVNERISVLYISRKLNLISSIETGQLIAAASTFLMLLVVPLAYVMILRTFFSPFLGFADTMTKIRNGEGEEKLRYEGAVTELHRFRDTFNEMMREIEELKIDSYEKELSCQKAELQVLQGQLKPHFYLNCLKTLYNMLQINNTQKASQMILWISDMLRYRFRNISERIPLSREVEQVKIFANIQNFSSTFRTKLVFDLTEETLCAMVPMMCIWTFVENAYKYARRPDRELDVEVSVVKKLADGKEFISVRIQDNGDGFPQEFTDGKWMQEMEGYEVQGTGIHNMWSRLKLLYGKEAGMICMNNTIGGYCQLIFPLEPALPESDT